MGQVFSYRPTPERLALIDEYIKNWKDFCDRNVDNLKNKNWGEMLDKMTYCMIAIISGALIFSVGFIWPNMVMLFVYWIIGGILVTIGSIRAMLLYLEKNKIRKGL